MHEPGVPRLLIQYLEPSPAVERAVPERLRDHLVAALEQLPVTDLALGWRLGPEVIETVRPAIPAEVVVWRWVPAFTDSGDGRLEDAFVAVGPDGQAPPPFHDLPDFRFLCLDRGEVIEAGLERARALVREIDADGVLLDRIRWHSPSASPMAELTCFCGHSRERAARDGLDLDLVATDLRTGSGSLTGRRALVAALLGRGEAGSMADFLAWRTQRVTEAVDGLASGLRGSGFSVALDVFTPALAASVGQDLSALSGSGEWAKSMTYFDALGPAAMPFELRGYAAWLEAAGEPDARGFLSNLLGFDPPGIGGAGPQLRALGVEAERLSEAMGAGPSIVGIDAVEMAGVCEIADEDLDARIATIRDMGLGLSPCWELLFMDGERIGRISAAWAG